MARHREPIQHGTPGGYKTHRNRGVPMDDECGCRAANAAYASTWRHRRDARRNAREAAYRRLAERFPATFDILIAKELSR